MVAEGDDAPDFEATRVEAEIEPFQFSEGLGDGPVVLVFFPAAFSGVCTDELCSFRDSIGQFADVGGTVLAASTDLPHAQREFRSRNDLPFALVADPDHRAIEAHDVVSNFEHLGVDTVARRSVFVIDREGTVTYRWLADNPGQVPDYEAVTDAVVDAA